MIRRLAIALLAFLPLPATAGSDLSGTNGYWELASDLGFDADANFPITVSAWVRPDTVSGFDVAFNIEDKGDQNRTSLDVSSGTLRSNVTASGGTGTASSVSKVMTAGKWYHVVAILDDTATATFVWIDGSFLGGGSGTTRVLADMDTTTLGCSWSGASAAQNFFDGAITNVAVWSVALTEPEIRRLCMDRFSVRKVRPESLVLHCPAEVMTGSVCVDVVGARQFTKNGTIADSSDDGPFGFTPPGLGTWTPASLTGVVAWVKGDAGVTGNPVTTWADQSGAGNDLDIATSGAPVPTSDGYGGRAGVQFTNDILSGQPAPATAYPVYGLMVMKLVTVGNNDVEVWIGDKDAEDLHCWNVREIGSDGWGAGAGDGTTESQAQLAGPAVSGSGVRSLEFDQVDATSRRISSNAGQQGTNTTSRTPAGPDAWAIGGRADLTPSAATDDFTMYELVIATSAPTDAQRLLWAVYVKHRWNVTGGPIRYE